MSPPNSGHGTPPRHMRRSVSNDPDDCVCITCHMRCENNAQLGKHGKRKGHNPYGCVCGSEFSRLYTLERHIASKNGVTIFTCPLCRDDEAPRRFARPDHVLQHLKTYHKIPDGILPDDVLHNSIDDHAPGYPTSFSPQNWPSFPCPMLGCRRTGRYAYVQQLDLEEHLYWEHCTAQDDLLAQGWLSNPIPIWANDDFQHDARLLSAQMLAQNMQQSAFWHPESVQYSPNGEGLAGNGGFSKARVSSLDGMPELQHIPRLMLTDGAGTIINDTGRHISR